MAEGAANLRALYALADPDDLAEGRLAYWRYNAVLRGFAGWYRVPFDRTVAAFVALSPNNDYFSNLRSLATVLQWRHEAPARITCSTYDHCKLRALDYALGRVSFLERVKGPKIRSFYMNIFDPSDPQPVTVDGHIHAAWAAQAWTMREALVGSKRLYNHIADDVRDLAAEHGLLGNQAQAILWFARKRTQGIVYTPQRQIFAARSDAWGSIVEPQDAPPYPLKPKD